MKKIVKRNHNSLMDSTWDLEFREWELELKNRRLKFCETWNVNHPYKIDSFYDISDRCWGEINGRLAMQYFRLLVEIEGSCPDLHKRYHNLATETLNFFSFYAITRNDYTKHSTDSDS